jgi:hydrocephalus-inducing protein
VFGVQLPPNNYVSSGRRRPEMIGPAGDLSPLDPTTMAVEMESLGIGVRNVKRFYVLNPTSIPYEFHWQDVPVVGRENVVPRFHCCTRKGIMSAGRRYEMMFEFTPREDETQESFWNFRVPEQVCRRKRPSTLGQARWPVSVHFCIFMGACSGRCVCWCREYVCRS